MAYLEFGLGEGGPESCQLNTKEKTKSTLINITTFTVAEISPIKGNGKNTIKIRVFETLFTVYLLIELIFLYFIFQTYTEMLCNKPMEKMSQTSCGELEEKINGETLL